MRKCLLWDKEYQEEHITDFVDDLDSVIFDDNFNDLYSDLDVEKEYKYRITIIAEEIT